MIVDTGETVTVTSSGTGSITINYYAWTRSKGSNTSLTTKYDDSSGVTYTSSPLYFLKGQTIYITASASAGYTLTLTVGGTARTSPYTHTITGSGAVTTTATANTYTITYYQGNGTSTAGNIAFSTTTTCTYGTNCTLSTYSSLGGTFPNNDKGWSFYGWSDSQSGTTRTYTDGESFTYSLYEYFKI